MNDHNAPHGTFGDRMNIHSDKELSDLLDFSAVSRLTLWAFDSAWVRDPIFASKLQYGVGVTFRITSRAFPLE